MQINLVNDCDIRIHFQIPYQNTYLSIFEVWLTMKEFQNVETIGDQLITFVQRYTDFTQTDNPHACCWLSFGDFDSNHHEELSLEKDLNTLNLQNKIIHWLRQIPKRIADDKRRSKTQSSR